MPGPVLVVHVGAEHDPALVLAGERAESGGLLARRFDREPVDVAARPVVAEAGDRKLVEKEYVGWRIPLLRVLDQHQHVIEILFFHLHRVRCDHRAHA